jgi:hypothetical protein
MVAVSLFLTGMPLFSILKAFLTFIFGRANPLYNMPHLKKRC